MLEEKKETVELKEEELEKVSGGIFPNMPFGYDTNNLPNLWFDTGTIVEDNSGVRLRILELESIDHEDTSLETKWFYALVIYVPESAMCYTSWRENEVHTVNSSMVHKV